MIYHYSTPQVPNSVSSEGTFHDGSVLFMAFLKSGGHINPDENTIQIFFTESIPRHCRLTVVHFAFISPSLWYQYLYHSYNCHNNCYYSTLAIQGLITWVALFARLGRLRSTPMLTRLSHCFSLCLTYLSKSGQSESGSAHVIRPFRAYI